MLLSDLYLFSVLEVVHIRYMSWFAVELFVSNKREIVQVHQLLQ